jgi:hypothetical protein
MMNEYKKSQDSTPIPMQSDSFSLDAQLRRIKELVKPDGVEIVMLTALKSKPPGFHRATLNQHSSISNSQAERVGFEPTVGARPTTVFETAPIGHSGTSPNSPRAPCVSHMAPRMQGKL